jgi:protein-S-isoprenylcysteine O-methyltransferase Ste14
MLLLRSIFFAALIPGTVVVLVPGWIVRRSHAAVTSSGSMRAIAVSLMAAGASVLLWCIWDFGRKGQGTLAPVDPPTKLVVYGLYRYVRNPMYLGALMVLAGQAILFQSSALVVYVIGWFAFVHLFVVFYEERTLRQRFGEGYERYCQTVPRWVPRRVH